MKITFLSPSPNLSGGQRVIATYADQLTLRGHDVTVVARKPAINTLGVKFRNLARGRKSRAVVRETHFDRMKARLHIPSHDGPITANDVPDADVVVATWWETAFEVVHFPINKGRKFYFVQHHEVHDYLPNHISGASYFLPLKKITISSWLVEVMRDLYGDHDVALVPNAIDHSLFFSGPRARQDRPTLGLMYSAKPYKGFDVASQAIKIISEDFPDVRVAAFGTNNPAKNLPLPENTKFFLNPKQVALRDIYASCDVFIAPSRLEGFGLPILEAMACRTPVVATQTGCAEDVIEEGRSGHIVRTDDPEALAKGLSKILSLDATSWQAMSEAAYSRSLEFTWGEAASLFEAALL